jgi:hypothetical protein
MGIFKSLNGYTDDGCYENRKALCFNDNKIKGTAELTVVILNCTLLHNKKDG